MELGWGLQGRRSSEGGGAGHSGAELRGLSALGVGGWAGLQEEEEGGGGAG